MEPRFLEIQEVLGDKAAVAEIGPRCGYLLMSPDACRRLPPHFQVLREHPGSVGKPCPLNPEFNPNVQAKVNAAMPYAEILDFANQLHSDSSMELFMSTSTLSPGEYCALREALSHARQKEKARLDQPAERGRRTPRTVSGGEALTGF